MKVKENYRLGDGCLTVFEEDSPESGWKKATYRLITRKRGQRIETFLDGRLIRVVCRYAVRLLMVYYQHDWEVAEFLRTRGEGYFSRPLEVQVKRRDISLAERRKLKRQIKKEMGV